jgi:chaperone required for assembly of F1-ATPase
VGPVAPLVEKRFGTPLLTTYSLTRLDQPQAAHEAVGSAFDALDIHMFTVLHLAVSLSGSIVLGMAFTEGAMTAPEVWRCTLCEELHYERIHDLEKHGLDPTEQKRRDGMLRDLEAAARYMRLIQASTI